MWAHTDRVQWADTENKSTSNCTGRLTEFYTHCRANNTEHTLFTNIYRFTWMYTHLPLTHVSCTNITLRFRAGTGKKQVMVDQTGWNNITHHRQLLLYRQCQCLSLGRYNAVEYTSTHVIYIFTITYLDVWHFVIYMKLSESLYLSLRCSEQSGHS